MFTEEELERHSQMLVDIINTISNQEKKQKTIAIVQAFLAIEKDLDEETKNLPIPAIIEMLEKMIEHQHV